MKLLSPIVCASLAFLVLAAVAVLTVAAVLAIRPPVQIVMSEG
jgi:hypothetical protein